MNENSKRLAASLATQTVSRRLMRDFVEHVQTNTPPSIDANSLPEVVGDYLDNVVDISPALARQLGHIGVEERIVIVKAKEVTTPIERLAKCLREGIEAGIKKDAHCIVEARTIDEQPRRFDETKNNQIEIIYVPDSERDYEDELKRVAAHRVVYVRLPDSRVDKALLKKVLWHSGLADDGEPRRSAYIPTVIVPHPEPGLVPFETISFADYCRDANYRERKDASVLRASSRDPASIPEKPARIELERWGRNVMFRQVAFATSGGGACAFRDIALLERLADVGLPVDVYAGLSGGAFVGAYFVGGGNDGLDLALDRGETVQNMLPAMAISSVHIQRMVDADLGYQQVGRTSIDFCPVTTEMRKEKPPGRRLIRQATLGQAVRASGGAPVIFGPVEIDRRRYTDGMASSIVPTEVAVDHGGDVVLACNCIPGPNRSNPFANHWLGRLAYETPVGRFIDMLTWLNFMTQTASEAYGAGANVFFQFDTENISTFEPLQWGQSHVILDKARQEHEKIDDAVASLKKAWEGLQ